MTLFATVKAASRRIGPPTKAILTLTPRAISRLKQLEKQGSFIKIGVKTKGCSGMAYSLDYAKERNKFDEEVNQEGVRVIIDSKALFTIIGSEMDYVEDKLASQFVFNNPNIDETCGCGMSFSVSKTASSSLKPSSNESTENPNSPSDLPLKK